METNTLRPFPGALLNPRYDANFKAIFTDSSPDGSLALKSFLEAVLNAEVSEIQLVQNELPIESEYDKQSVFDITCTLNGAKAVNIELQGLNRDNSYDRRAEYQAAHLLNHSVKKGMDWKDMPEVFQISVLNFIYDGTTKNGLSVYTMRTEDGRHLSNRMTILFIELPKYRDRRDRRKRIENLTADEKWCKFLLYADDVTRQNFVRDLCKSDGGIMAASGILSKISQDDINWVRQKNRDLWERDQISFRNYVKRASQEAEEAKKETEEAKKEAERAKKETERAEKRTEEAQSVIAKKDAQIAAQLQEIEVLRKKLSSEQTISSNCGIVKKNG